MKTTQTSSVQQQIFDLENELISAMKASDVATLERLLHDDFLFIAPDGQTFNKKIELESHHSGKQI